MTATEQFVELLGQRGLLPGDTLDRLRRSLAAADRPVPPRAVAERLVKAGHLTPAQAKQVLGEVQSSQGASESVAAGQASLLEEELGVSAGAEGQPLDALMGGEAFGVQSSGTPLQTVRRRRGPLDWLRGRGKSPTLKSKRWDSPVVLVNGGLLLLLVIIAGALYWAVGRQSGDDAVGAADADYTAGAYTQAISKYEQYLERFPSHPAASHARVRIGLAQMRQHVGSPSPEALATAKEVIERISPEEAFHEARGELAAMLPELAEGLARRAVEQPTPEALAHAREAFELAGNPNLVSSAAAADAAGGASVSREKLREIDELLGLAQRAIDQQRELDAAIKQIDESLETTDTRSAYDAYFALLRQYPTLSGNEALDKAVARISQAQQARVAVIDEPVQAQPGADGDAPSETSATVAVMPEAKAVPGAGASVLVAVVGDGLYGFNVSDGSPRWQRPLAGSLVTTSNMPVPQIAIPDSAAKNGDFVLVLGAADQLWSVNVDDGAVRWRLKLPAPATGPPVMAGRFALLSTTSGEVWWIDAGTGTATRRVQLGQSLGVPPAVDLGAGRVLQCATHSNLFVLAGGTGECTQVVHLGHRAETIHTRPTPLGDWLLLPVNSGPRSSVLHVLAAADGFATVQQVRFKGHFDRPVQLEGGPNGGRSARRAVAVTDRGATRVFELSPADPERPLVALAEQSADDHPPLTRYVFLGEGRLLLADTELTAYSIDTATNRLDPKWVAVADGPALQPLRPAGNDALARVYRQSGQPTAVIETVRLTDGERLWAVKIQAAN